MLNASYGDVRTIRNKKQRGKEMEEEKGEGERALSIMKQIGRKSC